MTTKPAPDVKRRGRPPVPPDQRRADPVRTLRLADELWAEFQARGGVEALRARLAKARPANGL